MALIPTEWTPRWGDLPALAWLVTDRFAGPVGRVPVLGAITRLAGWPATMIGLAGAHAGGACAAYGRGAVLTVRRHHPRLWRWRRGLLLLVGYSVVGAMLAIIALMLLTAGVVAEHAGFPAGITVGGVAAAVSVLGIAAVIALDASPGLGAFAPRDRAAARAWARNTGVVLLEANMLVSDPDQDRAATILARHLLAHADAGNIAFMARPRTARVAKMYRTLRFTPLPGGQGRILLRPARPEPPRVFWRL